MLSAERQNNGVVCGGALQFEIKRAAKAFAQGQTPGAVEARAEAGVDDELHAAGFVKETFHDDGFLRRQGAERAVGIIKVSSQLQCAYG